jgi:hypothetical protein
MQVPRFFLWVWHLQYRVIFCGAMINSKTRTRHEGTLRAATFGRPMGKSSGEFYTVLDIAELRRSFSASSLITQDVKRTRACGADPITTLSLRLSTLGYRPTNAHFITAGLHGIEISLLNPNAHLAITAISTGQPVSQMRFTLAGEKQWQLERHQRLQTVGRKSSEDSRNQRGYACTIYIVPPFGIARYLITTLTSDPLSVSSAEVNRSSATSRLQHSGTPLKTTHHFKGPLRSP